MVIQLNVTQQCQSHMTLTCDNMEGSQKHSTDPKDPKSRPHASISVAQRAQRADLSEAGECLPIRCEGVEELSEFGAEVPCLIGLVVAAFLTLHKVSALGL